MKGCKVGRQPITCMKGVLFDDAVSIGDHIVNG